MEFRCVEGCVDVDYFKVRILGYAGCRMTRMFKYTMFEVGCCVRYSLFRFPASRAGFKRSDELSRSNLEAGEDQTSRCIRSRCTQEVGWTRPRLGQVESFRRLSAADSTDLSECPMWESLLIRGHYYLLLHPCHGHLVLTPPCIWYTL